MYVFLFLSSIRFLNIETTFNETLSCSDRFCVNLVNLQAAGSDAVLAAERSNPLIMFFILRS